MGVAVSAPPPAAPAAPAAQKCRVLRSLERKAALAAQSVNTNMRDRLLPVAPAAWSADAFQRAWWRLRADHVAGVAREGLEDASRGEQDARAVVMRVQKAVVQQFAKSSAELEASLKAAREDVETAAGARFEAGEGAAQSRARWGDLQKQLEARRSFLSRVEVEALRQRAADAAERQRLEANIVAAREQIAELRAAAASAHRLERAHQLEEASRDASQRQQARCNAAAKVNEESACQLEEAALARIKERLERAQEANKNLEKRIQIEVARDKVEAELKCVGLENQISNLRAHISSSLTPRVLAAERERDRLHGWASVRPAYAAAESIFSAVLARLAKTVHTCLAQIEADTSTIESKTSNNAILRQRLEDRQRGLALSQRKQDRLAHVMRRTVKEIATAQESFVQGRRTEAQLKSACEDLMAAEQRNSDKAAWLRAQREGRSKAANNAATRARTRNRGGTEEGQEREQQQQHLEEGEQEDSRHPLPPSPTLKQHALHPLAVKIAAYQRHGVLLRAMLSRLRARAQDQKRTGKTTIEKNLSMWKEENLVVEREAEAIDRERAHVAREEVGVAEASLQGLASTRLEYAQNIRELSDRIETSGRKVADLENMVTERTGEGKELCRAAKKLRPVLEKANRLATDLATSVAEVTASLQERKAEAADMLREKDATTARCKSHQTSIARLEIKRAELTEACEAVAIALAAKETEIERKKALAKVTMGDWSVTKERAENKSLHVAIKRGKEDLSDLQMLERQVENERAVNSAPSSRADGGKVETVAAAEGDGSEQHTAPMSASLEDRVKAVERSLEEALAEKQRWVAASVDVKRRCRRQIEKDEIVSEALADELKALDTRATDMNERVQQWESDYATWKKEVAEAHAKALAEAAKEEADRKAEEEAGAEAEAEAQAQAQAQAEAQTKAEGEEREEKREAGAAENDAVAAGKNTTTKKKKQKTKKKKKKKSPTKNKTETKKKATKKTAAEIEHAQKEKEFEERRMQCVTEMTAMQADMKRLSEVNYKYGSGGSTVETDGMVEKLRGTVASAHLVANVEKAGGGDVAGGDDSSIVGDDRS